MIPIRSNLNKENCSPISSNCVIWQGEDLPCIELCTGDSVSDVIFKLATELCNLKNSFGFTDVDLACILKVCTVSPEPQKTLTNILNLIINKICCMNDIVVALENAATPAEINIKLASCFNLLNPQGVPLTELPHSEYTIQIGIKLCDLWFQVATLQTQVDDLTIVVNGLVGAPAVTFPTVTPNCVLASVPTAMSLVLDELEKQFCELRTATGFPADITPVTAQQCPNLNTLPALSHPGTMVAQPHWWAAPSNLGQSLVNLWITVCDIRGAVKTILDTCCKVNCDDFVVDFDVKRTVDSVTGNEILLLFVLPRTTLPSTWYDCNQTLTTFNPYGFKGNQLTITDTAGHTFLADLPLRKAPITSLVGILEDQTAIQSGYAIDIHNSPLDPLLDFTIDSNICVTDGSTTCIKCLTKAVPYVPTGCCTITNTSKTESVIVMYSTI